MTLYRFDKDSANPPTSNCASTGGCITAWPPVPATTSVGGISAGLVGSITRTDGTKQLTIAGWPMYYFAKDTAAGQTSGQGVFSVWWVIAPDGSEIKTAAPSASSTH